MNDAKQTAVAAAFTGSLFIFIMSIIASAALTIGEARAMSLPQAPQCQTGQF